MAGAGARSRSSGPLAVGDWKLADGGWWLVVGGWRLAVGGGDTRPRALAASPFFFRLNSRLGELATAESTRAIWAASSVGEPAMTASPPRAARHALTPMPSAATAAKKTRAWRSAGVGMLQSGALGRMARHRFRAIRCGLLHTTDLPAYRNNASATSPTIFSDAAETLSMVSSNEWWYALSGP